MKTIWTSIIGAALLGLSAGCASNGNTAHTKRGAVGGAVLGGIVGGVIGHQSGRGLEGAAIGAGVGAAGGAALGSAKDEQESDYPVRGD